MDMGTDPCVIGQVQGSDRDYGAPLYAQPDYNVLEHPWYSTDNMWRLRWGADDAAIFDASLTFLGDRTLMAEIHCFRESGWIIVELDADIAWLEDWKWQAGCIQEASIHCLKWQCFQMGVKMLCSILFVSVWFSISVNLSLC